MIKTYQSSSAITASNDHKLMPESTQILYTRKEGNSNVLMLEWDPLPTPASVSYTVTVTEDPQANLNSACILNQDVYMANNYRRFSTLEPNYQIGALKGRETKVNVAAQVMSGENKGLVAIYQSFSITIPVDQEQAPEESKSGRSILFVLLFLTIASVVAYILI
jgi:hypothetical protein